MGMGDIALQKEVALELIISNLQDLKTDIKEIKQTLASQDIEKHKLLCSQENCNIFVKKSNLESEIRGVISKYNEEKIDSATKKTSLLLNIVELGYKLGPAAFFGWAAAKYFIN